MVVVIVANPKIVIVGLSLPGSCCPCQARSHLRLELQEPDATIVDFDVDAVRRCR